MKWFQRLQKAQLGFPASFGHRAYRRQAAKVFLAMVMLALTKMKEANSEHRNTKVMVPQRRTSRGASTFDGTVGAPLSRVKNLIFDSDSMKMVARLKLREFAISIVSSEVVPRAIFSEATSYVITQLKTRIDASWLQ